MTSQFINRDCNLDLPYLQDKFFNLALLDPPYGINESKKKRGNFNPKQKNGNRIRIAENSYTKSDWDNEIPSDEYFQHIKRISCNQIIFGANYFPAITNVPSFKAPRREFFNDFIKSNPVGWILWDKVNGTNDFSDCELIWTSFDFPSFILPYMWNGMMQGLSIHQGTIVQGNKKLNEKRIHPTQKPTLLYLYLLDRFVKPNQMVIDTHVGSGSSLIACEKLKISYLAYEKDTNIFSRAQNRLNIFRSQLTLNY